MRVKSLLYIYIILSVFIATGCSSTQQVSFNKSITQTSSVLSLDTIKAGRFDTGKMWTFEYPPTDYFKEEYNFSPTQQWYDKVKMSALRFADYCSASFISEDGLIMTNNHCARESAVSVSKEGEDFQKNGFYANTITDERPVPDLYVEQLILTKDVTEEVQAAIDEGSTDQEKLNNEHDVIDKIQKREEDATGLTILITPLYNGGKYSLYGYKRYTDVRLVFTPEHLLGHFGGEYDNFTYPRYNLDCAFFRVYDEGKPVKTENYLKWSTEGVEAGEPVFVVGNPGSTSRLLTVSQLEYLRDVVYPQTLQMYNSLISLYQGLIDEKPDSSEDLYVQLLRCFNAQKVFSGMIKGLNDPILMQKKKDFEHTFQSKIQANEKLNDEYGDLWRKISGIENEMRDLSDKAELLTIDTDSSSLYFFVARDVVDLADELNMPDSERTEYYKGKELDSTIAAIIPESYDRETNRDLLVKQLRSIINKFGEDDYFVHRITNGKDAETAADYMLNNSVVDDPEDLKALINQGPDAILHSKDLFIYYIIHASEKISDFEQRSTVVSGKEELYNQMLGKALFAAYGTSIPPDATFTLRIADGVVEGYPYNGTIAPPITTFYGMYDRYYSFNKKEPFDLPAKWQNPPADFDLSVPFNFVSTNDITGGNSGSPVINKNAEIVGVAFDGNIESLPGNFIFTTEQNRTVSVHSAGIIEALSKIYSAQNLVDEILKGKIEKKETALTK